MEKAAAAAAGGDPVEAGASLFVSPFFLFLFREPGGALDSHGFVGQDGRLEEPSGGVLSTHEGRERGWIVRVLGIENAETARLVLLSLGASVDPTASKSVGRPIARSSSACDGPHRMGSVMSIVVIGDVWTAASHFPPYKSPRPRCDLCA